MNINLKCYCMQDSIYYIYNILLLFLAVVNQTSDNHISCLVHSLFNVSIVRPEHQPFNNWSGSKIKKNDKINVKVLSFDLTKKLPHITGEIIDNK